MTILLLVFLAAAPLPFAVPSIPDHTGADHAEQFKVLAGRLEDLLAIKGHHVFAPGPERACLYGTIGRNYALALGGRAVEALVKAGQMVLLDGGAAFKSPHDIAELRRLQAAQELFARHEATNCPGDGSRKIDAALRWLKANSSPLTTWPTPADATAALAPPPSLTSP